MHKNHGKFKRSSMIEQEKEMKEKEIAIKEIIKY